MSLITLCPSSVRAYLELSEMIQKCSGGTHVVATAFAFCLGRTRPRAGTSKGKSGCRRAGLGALWGIRDRCIGDGHPLLGDHY